MRAYCWASSTEDIPTYTHLLPTCDPIPVSLQLSPPPPPAMSPVNMLPLHLQRTEEIATLRESMLSLWSEEGPWPLTLGSKRVFMSLVRQRFFIKDLALGELLPVNSWGLYQAVRWAAESLGLPRVAAQPQGGMLCMSCVSGRWLQWKTVLLNLVAQQRPRTISAMTHWKPAAEIMSLTLS